MSVARRILAALVAIFVIGLGAFLVAEAVPQLAGRNQPLWVDYYVVYTELTRRTWSDAYVFGAGAAMLVLGLALLVLGLRRAARPLPLAAADQELRVELPPRHLRRIAENTVSGFADITKAKVKARRRKIRIKAATHPDAPSDLDRQIRQRLGDQIDALAPARRRPGIALRLKRKGR